MDGLTAHFRALPDEAPLAMPTQCLRTASASNRMPTTTPRMMLARRMLVIGGAILFTAEGAHEMYLVLGGSGLTILQLGILAVFVVLFAWIALAFTSAVCGFFSLIAGGGSGLGISVTGPLPSLASRTALLMPTYNEAPTRVMAALEAIHGALRGCDAVAHFDIFILSDTTDPDVWIAEEAAFLALRGRTGDDGRIFYRRRPKNIQRKAGNIGEWVRRFGASYPQMLVLDADSVMTGEVIVRMAAAMERNPDVGLIQTLPIIVNGSTLFARMQQFAGRVYGPLIAHGIAWWHGSEGNYWGHNAVIRTQAFAEQAGLPELRGRKPFGGHILSHDFVEAALMRRGGWAVHMIPSLQGSYEESPPSLTELAVRDRRWCQGNLQHAAVLSARGLHWVSRLHLLMGIGSYITAPLWLLFLVTGILISLQARFVPPNYFPAGRSLFPLWPSVDPVRSMWVFVGTMAVLLAPKMLAYVVLLFNAEERRGCGGAIRAFVSLLLETLIAGLIAPVAMLIQSMHVVSILGGRDGGWQPQKRDDGGIAFRDVARAYWRYTVFGLLLGVLAFFVSFALALWMSPVVIGLALAIPLVALTGSRKAGLALRRAGLLLIPEERAPPSVLEHALALQRDLATAPTPPSLQRLLSDPALLGAHRAMLAPPRRPREGPIDPHLVMGLAKLDEVETLQGASTHLAKSELAAVLADRRGLDRLASLRA